MYISGAKGHSYQSAGRKKKINEYHLLPGGGGKVHDANPLDGEVVQIHRHHLAKLRPAPVVGRCVSVGVRRKDRVPSDKRGGQGGAVGGVGPLKNTRYINNMVLRK